MSSNSKKIPELIKNNILKNKKSKLFMARPSISGKTFLADAIVTIWERTDLPLEEYNELTDEENVSRDKFFFKLSRRYRWGKKLRWNLEKILAFHLNQNKIITRTNANRPPAAPLKVLDNNSNNHTESIQEYFIPLSQFSLFIEKLKKILKEENSNFLGSTFRFVNKDEESFLSYSPKEDSISILIYINQELTEEGRINATKLKSRLIDLAIKHRGRFYLTYSIYTTKEQIKRLPKNSLSQSQQSCGAFREFFRFATDNL